MGSIHQFITMRRCCSWTLAFVGTASSLAQEPESWVDNRTDIAQLHQPVGSLWIRLDPFRLASFLLFPAPIGVMAITDKFPAQYSYLSTPELASFIVSPDAQVTEDFFDFLVKSNLQRTIVSYGDASLPEALRDGLQKAGVTFEIASPDAIQNAQKSIAASPAIGRFFAVRMQCPSMILAVQDLRYLGKPMGGLTINTGLALLDIGPADGLSTGFHLAERFRPYSKPPLGKHLLKNVINLTAELYWLQLPDSDRELFIDRFANGNGAKVGTAPFVEACRIAMLYPTTFETEPVGAFAYPTHWPPSPPSGEFLERIRYVDALLDPIEEAFLNSLPDNAREHRDNVDHQPE